MITPLLVCLVLSIEAPDVLPRIKPGDTELVKRVEAALQPDKELLPNHRGYLSFLKKNPAIARAEDAWLDLTLLLQFESLARDFDEALQRDAEAETLFDRYYDQSARDEALRNSVERLQRAEFGKAKKATYAEQPFSAALDYLRANPDLAMRFLQGPEQVKPAPRALYPYLDHFKEHPELLKELLDAFQGITGNPLAQTRLFPWWQAIANFNLRSGGAYSRLTSHFLAQPQRFWVWHQHNLALAADAHARTWIRYWHRKVRRIPSLETDYNRYLDLLRKYPELGDRAEQRWTKEIGPAPEWPPKENPPLLAKWTKEVTTSPGTAGMPKYKMPEKPKRPEVKRPAMPTMPTMPTRPTRPEKPPTE